MKITGAEAIVRCLAEEGVATVFGYPGGAVIPLYNALYEGPVRHILTAHEQGAIHAADGYARATGKVGVCIATSGPGATNIITGLATAYLDSIPLVAITGQVATTQLGRDSFQEIDIVSVSMAVTKHNYLVMDPSNLLCTLREAFAIACDGRPGPVLVDIPNNIQTSLIDWQPKEIETVAATEKRAKVVASPIAEAVRVLSLAEQPVILVGGGLIRSQTSEAFRRFAEKGNYPVASTLMGLGAFPGNHSQFMGLTGMHGNTAANKTIYEADVIIAVGTRFSDRVTGDRVQYAKQKTVIQIDVDPSEVDKNIPTQIGLLGAMNEIIGELTEASTYKVNKKWWNRLNQWRETSRKEFQEQVTEKLTAPWIMQVINRFSENQPVVCVTDVGQNQMWAAQHLVVEKPRGFITSGGCGTMGFGLPAALGVQVGQPHDKVIHICGDGGFKMTGMELYTIANYDLPILSIIIDNQSLGMVRQWQKMFYNARYSATTLPNFDFCGFAGACGIQSGKATGQTEFQNLFTKAWSYIETERKPFVVVAAVSADDIVLPMIAPGSTLDKYVEVFR